MQRWDSGAAVEEFYILELSGNNRAGFVWDSVEMFLEVNLNFDSA